MKTAISIPDALFEAAEAAARSRRVSRSRLYTEAIRKYLTEHADRGVTERLDLIYADADPGLSRALARMQALVLTAEEW